MWFGLWLTGAAILWNGSALIFVLFLFGSMGCIGEDAEACTNQAIAQGTAWASLCGVLGVACFLVAIRGARHLRRRASTRRDALTRARPEQGGGQRNHGCWV